MRFDILSGAVMNPDDHLDVASGAIVPSSCGELAFRVIKKVRRYNKFHVHQCQTQKTMGFDALLTLTRT